MIRLTSDAVASPYFVRTRPQDALDDGKGPMMLRPQAINFRNLGMPNPVQMGAINNLFNRAGGNMRASGMVLGRVAGNGVRASLGW